MKNKAKMVPGMLPLDYLLSVINDPNVDAERRDRLAIIALPYCHPKLITDRLRKKEIRDRKVKSAAAESEWQDEMQAAA